MAVAETAAARKLLHGARGVAAFSFGLDGLWQLISGFFADIFAGLAHLLALPFEAIWHLLVAAANTWLVTVVAGAASAITSGLTGLWHLVAGFFPHLFAALAGAAHDLLVLPLAALWHWLAAAAGSIISGLGGLWHLVAGFFAHLFAALASAAHQLLVLPAEALWHWLIGAAGAIASGLHGLWHFVVGFFPNLFAALAGAAHDLLVLPLEALWHWLQSAAAVALHCVLGALAVLLLVALACCFGPAICKAFVLSARFLAGGPGFVAARARAVSFRPLPRGQQQQQGDEEEESLLVGAVDATTAWGRGQEEEVHHAWHIRTEGLDERAVAAIGAVVYDAREHQLPPCAVCLAELRDGEALRLLPPCGHAFHQGCIDTWLRDQDTCPLCRAPVQDVGTGDDVCAVCLAELQYGAGQARRLLQPCGHAFHQGCIDTWLRHHGTCPLCRAPVINQSAR
ncbi:hypothetical protein PR202_ga29253 [Eleusine coracana subsp. coracana]|uniref:RING-type domain-containing protein n=1 Tax=Eleusine coracana subsp. coracana TaxID=191504 RepID=A0AAV5DKP7_ELECO|nr:hypothetical protein PR202_ga29253 [Eleusine coracana subsp. coracana]